VKTPAVAALIVALATACASCTVGSDRTSTPAPAAGAPDHGSLPDVWLPDLTRMEKPVREQMEERSRALVSKLANPVTPSRELAEAFGDVGNLLLAANELDAAEAYYLHAEALAPTDMRWPYFLGHVYLSRSDGARAIASFERARALQPGDPATLVWLGNAYLDQGQPDAADASFAQALSVQPRMVAALFGSGRAALARRDYARAVDRFEQALAADPRASMVHYPLGLAYRGLGDIVKAEAHLQQRGGVEVGPPDPLMVSLRGLLRGSVNEEEQGIRALDAGDYQAAVEHFRRGLALAPDNASLRHKLGTALSLTGDTRGAFEQFSETLRRSPGFAQAHYSLGVLLASERRYQEAAGHFTTAVREEPNYVDARLRLGEMLQRMGQPDAALVQYESVIGIDPRVADARLGSAMALAQMQRFDEARQRLRQGQSLYPNRPEFGEALARLESVAPTTGRR
jgi:tetratricopeptide (TPR) repeat protein